MASWCLESMVKPIFGQHRNLLRLTNPSLKITSNFFSCNFHSSKWNFIKKTFTRRKYDSDKGNSDVVKGSKEVSAKKEQVMYPEENSYKFQKIQIHEEFGGVKGNGGFMFSPVSTARVTIQNKARNYNDEIRRQKQLNIANHVQNANAVTNTEDEISNIERKPGKSVNISKDAVAKLRETSTFPAVNYFASTTSKNVSEKVQRVKKFFDLPNVASPTNVQNDENHFDNKEKETSMTVKEGLSKEIDKVVVAFRKGGKDKQENATKCGTNDIFSHRKASSRKAGEKESLLQKYSVKRPGALNTDELVTTSDNHKPTRKPLKYTLNVHRKHTHTRSCDIPSSLSSNNSEVGSGKRMKKYDKMRMKLKSRKNHSDGSKGHQSKCDELLAKLGLVNDKKLRNKINGDLYMNLLAVLETADAKTRNEEVATEKKSKVCDVTREDILRTVLRSGEEGSDETDDERPLRNQISKKRKHDKPSNIDKFWGVGTQNQHEGNAKWKIVSRTPKGKSKRRQTKLRRRKGKIMRTRRGKYNIKRKQEKNTLKSKPEGCGDISQNE